MSTLADDPVPLDEPAPEKRRLVFRVLALCASLLSIYLLWSGERARVVDDLQLFAEPLARPGESLALRALLLTDVEAVEGPSLGRAEVTVRLLDRAGRELTRTKLLPAVTDSMEGALRVPADARATLRLEAAIAHTTAATPPVSRTLEVAPNAATTPAAPRLAGPLQHLGLGRVQSTGTEPAPSRFLPRIVAGSCIPELPCHMLVWVGEPASAINFKPSGSITVEGAPEPATETTGLVNLTFRVHGAEAEVILQASRHGALVAERAVRLPLSLGEARIDLAGPLVSAPSPISLRLTPPPGREHLILDTFVSGRWSSSRSLPFVTDAAPVPLTLLPEATGTVVRVQARSDRYSAEGSGARLFYVREPGESEAQALLKVAKVSRDARLDTADTDALADGLSDVMRADPQRWAAFLLAPLEDLRAPIPLAVSGRPAQLARIERLRTFLRFGVGAMLVLSALLLGTSLLRQGMRASEQAAAIMEEADASARPSLAEIKQDKALVVGWVVLVCLAFLAAALLIVAKPLWF